MDRSDLHREMNRDYYNDINMDIRERDRLENQKLIDALESWIAWNSKEVKDKLSPYGEAWRMRKQLPAFSKIKKLIRHVVVYILNDEAYYR